MFGSNVAAKHTAIVATIIRAFSATIFKPYP